MTSREYFCAARDAMERLATYDQRIEAKRELAVMRARRDGPSGRGGVTDPTKRIDDLVDMERDFERERMEDRRTVVDASSVLESYYRIDQLGSVILRARYLRLCPWQKIAEETGLSYDKVREAESVAHDRIDSEGIAAISGGSLRVTGAER